MDLQRRSVRKPVTIKGVGVHTGASCSVTLAPGQIGDGIVFTRADHGAHCTIPATPEWVVDTEYRTVLGRHGITVDTVEHLLAAVAGAVIDDLAVHVTGPELPIGDGSAQVYVDALATAGAVHGTQRSSVVRVSEPFTLSLNQSTYHVRPHDRWIVDVTFESDHPLIGRQSMRCMVSPKTFASDLAPARTFGFVDDVARLRARGLAQGATQHCGIALTNDGVQGGELRWPNEFARHKAVDLIGDLALLGARFQGEITAEQPGHRGNVELARALRERFGA